MRSTDIDRTMMSAGCALSAMYPPGRLQWPCSVSTKRSKLSSFIWIWLQQVRSQFYFLGMLQASPRTRRSTRTLGGNQFPSTPFPWTMMSWVSFIYSVWGQVQRQQILCQVAWNGLESILAAFQTYALSAPVWNQLRFRFAMWREDCPQKQEKK